MVRFIMKSKAFTELLAELDKLMPHQKKQIEEQLQQHPTDTSAVITLIEKCMEAGLSCPKCGNSEKIIRWGSSAGLQRYRYDSCKTTLMR